jgi:hypothetical protein
MSEKLNIDELLNCYVDGEASDRQATEVKRMILHDRKVADRVRELQRQRQLLAALPVESAPAELAESVKTMLERRTLLKAASSNSHHVVGSMHLFARKLIAAAAMLALLGGLGIIVYMVIGSGDIGRQDNIRIVANDDTREKAVTPGAKPVVPAMAAVELILKTSSPGGLNSVIAKTIDSRGFWACVTVNRQPSRTTYAVSCGKEDVAKILNELSGVWDKVEDKSLCITAAGEETVTVASVTTDQVTAVMTAPDLPSRVASAKVFAKTNAEGPEAAVVSNTNDSGSDLKIPKPALTSPDFDKAATASVEGRADKVSLTITVVSLE